MAETNGIYKCNICGNIVQMVVAGAGDLVCCGEPMALFAENTVDKEGKEKHVPVIKQEAGKVIVMVGSVEHPMDEAHHIQMIQLFSADILVGEKLFKPGEKPMAEFCTSAIELLKAKALCNLHGLWTS